MNIYLAGDIRDNTWREQLKRAVRLQTFLDPTEHHTILEEHAYTFLDLEQIRMSDMLLAYLDPKNPSLYGSSLEIGYAHGLGKPVILVDEMEGDRRRPWFGMARSIAVVTLPSLAEAITLLNAMPR